MKRKRERVNERPLAKKPKGRIVLPKKKEDEPGIQDVLPELLVVIREKLNLPWQYTFDIALYNQEGKDLRQGIKRHTAEIAKYGTTITEWFHGRSLIPLRSIACFSCFYGNLRLFQWAQRQMKEIMPGVGEFAILGAHSTLIKILVTKEDSAFVFGAQLLRAVETGRMDIINLVASSRETKHQLRRAL